MSIKSQKSINDECSDIFERSYSQSSKTATDDGSSGDDEDENLAKELMNNMTPAVLSKLRRSVQRWSRKVETAGGEARGGRREEDWLQARQMEQSSVDGCVRLWETSQPSPFATLNAPTLPAVLDVAIVPAREVVLAFCTVHIWDIYEECLLQTLKIKFPFLGVLGHKVEFGAYCIHP
ncbi:Periodic tryptophan protein 2, partial [Operophtera brumata]